MTLLQSSGGNTEFDNVWKQLQSSKPTEGETPDKGTSLAQAAAMLPQVVSFDSDSNTNNQNSATSTKIDVESLFSMSGTVAAADKPVVEPAKDIDHRPRSKHSKVVSNDEFAALFKTLEEVRVSDENNEKEPEVCTLYFPHHCMNVTRKCE